MQSKPTVENWTVPPSCQGQAVERAYGIDEDGLPWRRTTDRSTMDVEYERLGSEPPESWEPWQREPEVQS